MDFAPQDLRVYKKYPRHVISASARILLQVSSYVKNAPRNDDSPFLIKNLLINHAELCILYLTFV